MDEEYDEGYLASDEEYERTSQKMRLIDLILLPVCFMQLVAEAASMTLESLVRVLAAHRNYVDDQRDFAEEVRAEIEGIPSTEE
jgi:hypothetical protein